MKYRAALALVALALPVAGCVPPTLHVAGTYHGINTGYVWGQIAIDTTFPSTQHTSHWQGDHWKIFPFDVEVSGTITGNDEIRFRVWPWQDPYGLLPGEHVLQAFDDDGDGIADRVEHVTYAGEPWEDVIGGWGWPHKRYCREPADLDDPEELARFDDCLWGG